MGIERINPAELSPPIGYSQVTVAEGTRIVHVAGQVGTDATGEVVGPDHRSQTEQAMRNVNAALAAAGAALDDVAKTTMYIVDYGPEALGAVFEASLAVNGDHPPTTAATLIGVAALADPQHKIEIEATAVLA